jgi:hypothetical protein
MAVLKNKPMTPKEKAQELVEKMQYWVYDVEAVDGGGWDNCRLIEKSVKETAKQCALIAVDEILKQYYKLTDEHKYWQQVKTEIENL